MDPSGGDADLPFQVPPIRSGSRKTDYYYDVSSPVQERVPGQGRQLESSSASASDASTPSLHAPTSYIPNASTAELVMDSPRSAEYPASGDSSPYRRTPFRRYAQSEASSQGYTPRNYNANLYSPRSTPTHIRAGSSVSRGSTPRKDRLVKGKLDGGFGLKEKIPVADGSGNIVVLTDDILGMKSKLKLEELNEDDVEYAPTGEKEKLDPSKRPIVNRWSPIGTLLFLFYLGASLYYFYVRATQTLDMGYTWYGVLVLAVEIISSTSTYGYAVLLIKYTKSRKTRGLPLAKAGEVVIDEDLQFHVRVMVPCYKESTELVKETVEAALKAYLPARTKRTLYLCDDGNDPKKKLMLEQFGRDCVYITGRTRDPKGETNGKSNNLNNALKLIYGDMDRIPLSEIIVVFDADMIAKPNFYTKILEVMADDDCSLCLTPQGFHNVNPQTDIFNNLNLSFWEYMLPGCDGLGYIACTGTNFAIRAEPLRDCGWFPTYTITEDYALGMELKKRNYRAAYLNEYLAVGEAPEEVRNVFRQRSRWCKGQMQVLFSKACPLFDTGLPFGMRVLYTSVTWSYITNTLAVPMAILVPFIALVFGVYPLVINRSFALASTLFFVAGQSVTMFCSDISHLKPLWFVSIACHLLWFTFTKATFNVLISKTGLKAMVFKSTKKKGEGEEKARRCCAGVGDMEGTKDVYVICLSFMLSFITILVGIFQIADRPYTAQGDFRWYLLLSVFWAIYNIIAPCLFLFYIFKKGRVLEDFCSTLMLLGTLVAVGGLVCLWLVPADYQMSQVLNNSLQFFEAQRSGKLPRTTNVPWRGNSGLWDSIIGPGGRNQSLVGGWYDDGGFLKISYSTATTVMMLSWSFIEFKGGYKSSDNLDFGANTIRWGADYLFKCYINSTAAGNSANDQFVAQVGSALAEAKFWGPPERMAMERPAVTVGGQKPGTDVMAMSAAALASASIALSSASTLAAGMYLERAKTLYRLAQVNKGLYTRAVPQTSVPPYYPSVSMYDDLALAAMWLHLATRPQANQIVEEAVAAESDQYLSDAIAFYEQSLNEEGHVDGNPYRWDYENSIPALDLLLAIYERSPDYIARAREFVDIWLKGNTVDVLYTQKSLAKAMPTGTLQHTANAAFYAMIYAKHFAKNRFMRYGCWTRGQVGYMLGDAGRSFMVGYGSYAPRKVPHRAASCFPPSEGECTWETAYYSTDANYHTLRGALVGGPDENDKWSDDRDLNNPANRVNLLNNAGLTGALAGMVDYGVNMAKCEQGNGVIKNILTKINKQPQIPGQRWWEMIGR